MEVVVPLAIEVASRPRRAGRLQEPARVVEVVLGEEVDDLPERFRLTARHGGGFGEDRRGGAVVHLIGGVEPEAVEPIIADPHPYVIEHDLADGVAVRPVIIDRRTPVGSIMVVEIVPEGGEIIAVRPKVVVDHVQKDRQARPVARRHEPLESFGSSIRMLGSERMNAVVTPTLDPRRLCDRHQFDGRDPEFLEGIKPWDHRVESPLGGECADVEFVEDEVCPIGDAAPAALFPGKPRGIKNGRWLVGALGLPPGKADRGAAIGRRGCRRSDGRRGRRRLRPRNNPGVPETSPAGFPPRPGRGRVPRATLSAPKPARARPRGDRRLGGRPLRATSGRRSRRVLSSGFVGSHELRQPH